MFTSGEPKVRSLTIHIDTGNTIGPKGLPVVYGHPDVHTLLHVKVAFESSHDCKAKAVEILFKAAVNTHYFSQDEASRRLQGEQIFSSKHWDLQVERPKPGWIAKGNYVRQCSVILDPTLPSSSSSPFGAMRYVFEARLKGAKGFRLAQTDWVETQEVWVLNSTLPFPSTIPLDNSMVVHDQWKDILSYSLSIPTDTLCFGQVVPITVQVGWFRAGCAQEGEKVLVTNASFTLQETKTFRAMFVEEVHETSGKLLHIAVNTGWPQTVDGWQRTINVSLPASPTMSADMRTKYMDVAHTLVVVVEFKTSKTAKREKLRAQMDIHITAPRIEPSTTALPPQYGDAISGESMLMLGPPPALDANEVLPSYSRYE